MSSTTLRPLIPSDVPYGLHDAFEKNYFEMTHGSGHLMLFAGDQKVEHLNKDFHGNGIPPEAADPEHLFRIARKARIGVFATQVGMIARYGIDYPEVPYLAKLNSKTNLVKAADQDPVSRQWLEVSQVVKLAQESDLKILAVGYTVYLGSRLEAEMLHEAAQLVFNAHQHGLVTVLWMYPRGEAVVDERDPELIAGATGVGAALGSDFAKVNPPEEEGYSSAELLKEAVMAAGRTKVICAGGSSVDPAEFLQNLYDQIHIGGAAGSATGRNIYQKPFSEAVRMCNAITAITVDGASAEQALRIYRGG